MAEQTITVQLTLDSDLAKAFAKEAKQVDGESKKVNSSFNEMSNTYIKESNKIISTNSKVIASISSIGKGSGAMALKMTTDIKGLSDDVIRGDLLGAFSSMGRVAVDGFRIIGAEMALMTGGITLALGAIALLIQRVSASNKELIELQKNAAQSAIDLDKRMAEQIEDELDQQLEQRLIKYEDDLSAATILSNDKIKLVQAEIKKIGEITAFSSDEKIKKYYALKQEEKDLIQDHLDNMTKIEKKYQSDIDKIKSTSKSNKENEKKDDGGKEPEYMVDGVPYSEWLEGRKQHFAIVSASNRQLANLKQKEIDLSADATDKEIEDDKKKIESLKEKKIAQEEYNNSVMYGTANMMGAFADLNSALKGNAELSKTLARGSVIMSTAAGIMKAFEQGGVFGFVTGAAIAAQGVAQLARIDAQKFARGGDFVTSGPQTIIVGDNPGGRERVQVTPLSSPNYNGPQGGGSITMGDIIVHGNADSATVRAIDKSRMQQLRDLKRMLMELNYARQMPAFA
jgi:hypothetical protein